MSHRSNCPDDYEARRQGELAQEYGSGRWSNPYEDSYWNRDRACPDAADAWERGYRSAEMRAEQEREDDAARHRAAMCRAEAQSEEDAYYTEQQQRVENEAQAQEYYAEMEAAALEESMSADAVDPAATLDGPSAPHSSFGDPD